MLSVRPRCCRPAGKTLSASIQRLRSNQTGVLDLAGNNNSIGSLSGSGTVTNSGAYGANSAILTVGGLDASTAFSGVIKNGSPTYTTGLTLVGGTLTLAPTTGANTYSGATTVGNAVGPAAVLQAGSQNAFSANSAVTLNQTGVLDLAGNNNSIGSLSGSGTVTNSGTYGANSAILTVGGLDASTTFSGVIENGSPTYTTGLTLVGGVLILTGQSPTYSGPTEVAVGTLVVNGSLAGSAVQVDGGATLGGAGTVGSINALSGSIIAPGVLTPYSTLSANGTSSFASGSTFLVNINAAGQNDKLTTTGATTISGGTVQVKAAAGTYSPLSGYTLITAAGGVSGTFSSLSASSNFVFLSPYLSYDADDVYLRFKQVANFASQAQTPNQVATGGALQQQPVGSTLYNALIDQTSAGARTAFNALSGEIHASAVSSAFDVSRLPREAVLDRLSDPLGALPSSTAGFVASAAPVADMLSGNLLTTWGQFFGSNGHVAGDNNAGSIDRSLAGFIFGVDESLDNRYRFGLTGGYTQSTVRLPTRTLPQKYTAHSAAFMAAPASRRSSFAAARSMRSTVSRPTARRTSPVSSIQIIPPMAAERSRPSARRAGACRLRISPGQVLSSRSSARSRNRSRPIPSPKPAARRPCSVRRAPMAMA